MFWWLATAHAYSCKLAAAAQTNRVETVNAIGIGIGRVEPQAAAAPSRSASKKLLSCQSLAAYMQMDAN